MNKMGCERRNWECKLRRNEWKWRIEIKEKEHVNEERWKWRNEEENGND